MIGINYNKLYNSCNLGIIRKIVRQKQSCPASILSSLQFYFAVSGYSGYEGASNHKKEHSDYLTEAKKFFFANQGTFVYQYDRSRIFDIRPKPKFSFKKLGLWPKA